MKKGMAKGTVQNNRKRHNSGGMFEVDAGKLRVVATDLGNGDHLDGFWCGGGSRRALAKACDLVRARIRIGMYHGRVGVLLTCEDEARELRTGE